MKIWLISDTHFGDNDIRLYEKRPFDTTKDMDETMVANWNACVSEEDVVYHLGDVGDLSFVAGLKGHKRLIAGNHDTRSEAEYLAAGFEKVYDLPVIANNYFMLSHEPMYVNRNMPYANVFGHVHGNPMYKTVSERSYCVCVERNAYAPVSLDEIYDKIAEEEKLYDLSH